MRVLTSFNFSKDELMQTFACAGRACVLDPGHDVMHRLRTGDAFRASVMRAWCITMRCSEPRHRSLLQSGHFAGRVAELESLRLD